ncbi:MAG: hypothetical protein IJT81_01870 [Lachnospiraceae bacterium]|nr:hypothetical protein [Lachnospiraceae bacterium]
MISSKMLMADVLLYAGISYILTSLFDIYAGKRLGRETEGYKALRVQRFITLCGVSLVSIILLVLALMDFRISKDVESFLGVPYLGFWFYYMVSVFHRVKAEKGRFF